jgi:putative transposase
LLSGGNRRYPDILDRIFSVKRLTFETPGEVRFITFSCWQRLPILHSDWSKDIFVDQLAQLQQQHNLEIFAFCVMPSHVHLLLRLDPETARLSRLLAPLKSRTAKKLLTEFEHRDCANKAEALAVRERRVWQEGGGNDRNIFSAHEFLEKANYIESNPVKALLCATPEEYRWCSAGTSLVQRAPW